MAYKVDPNKQEAIATAKFIRMSPTKARQVVDLIRGRHVDDARRVLQFTRRGASAPVAKLLESAVANAETNRGLPGDELIVVRTWVDEGPTLRRFRPRAQGRATRIRKRTCHIAIVVGRLPEMDELPETPATRQTGRRVRKATADRPKARGAASGESPAEAAAPETTTRKTTARKKTTQKKTTQKKTTRKSTKKKEEGES